MTDLDPQEALRRAAFAAPERTLIDILRHTVEQHPDASALDAGSGALSYRELWDAVEALSARPMCPSARMTATSGRASSSARRGCSCDPLRSARAILRWQDIWLNEGFCCYTEWIWTEASGAQSIAQSAERHHAR